MAATALRRAPGVPGSGSTPLHPAHPARPAHTRRARSATLEVNLPALSVVDAAPDLDSQTADLSAALTTPAHPGSSFSLRRSLHERQQVAAEIRYERGLVSLRSAILVALGIVALGFAIALGCLLIAHLTLILGGPPPAPQLPVPIPTP